MRLPSINSFDKYRLRAEWRREHGETGLERFSVRGKPKIHGVSMSIHARPDGAGRAGKAVTMLRKGGDASSEAAPGYAAIRDEVEATLFSGRRLGYGEIGLLAEWAGPGIQKKDAVTKIDRPRLFVFAAWALRSGEDLDLSDRYSAGEEGIMHRDVISRAGLVTCPETLAGLINPGPHVEIVPWVTPDMRTEGRGDTDCVAVIAAANAMVDVYETEDPYIRDRFGITARGEGLVFMPECGAFSAATLHDFAELSWKAKTSAHAVKKTARPASLQTETPPGLDEFIDAFVTTARFEQILSELHPAGDPQRKDTGRFIQALVDDVLKESVEERLALEVPEARLLAALREASRGRYLEACEMASSPTPA